tara:strand:+ start:151 stop:330 length:180 start_codon:yes stop_codon:yes gene_type:complete
MYVRGVLKMNWSDNVSLEDLNFEDEGCPCCGIDLIENSCIECGNTYADTISGDMTRDEK